MAVSKRLRYEILRRDDNTCRYCGGRAPEVALTVDHVVPTALGGSDDPSNLVAACKDCNAGKTSSSPDAPLVDDVQEKALRWSAAMAQAVANRASERQPMIDYCRAFETNWDEYCTGGYRDPVWPEGGADSIEKFYKAGLPLDELLRALAISMDRPRVDRYEKFRYMCGIGWSVLTELQQAAQELVEAAETQDDTEPRWESPEYHAGAQWIWEKLRFSDLPHELLAGHIDSRRAFLDARMRWVA
jgi:hypothetical protein